MKLPIYLNVYPVNAELLLDGLLMALQVSTYMLICGTRQGKHQKLHYMVCTERLEHKTSLQRQDMGCVHQ